MKHATNQSRRLAFLDALRGVAALFVAIQHVYCALPGFDGVATSVLAKTIPSLGGFGVGAFFVLSGCVIPFAVGTDRVTPQYIARFIARRFVRLDIPYWVCILAYLAAARIVEKNTYAAVDGPVFVANLFYVNFVLGWKAVVEVGWTLAIEIQFYLAYLLLLALSQQVERTMIPGRTGLSRGLVFGGPAIVSLLWQLKVIPDPPGPDRFFLQPWLFFFSGTVIAWKLFQGGEAWPGFLGVLGLSVSGVVGGEAICYAGAVTAATIWAVGERGMLRTLGTHRVLQGLGTMSYSLYLLHPLVGSRPIRLLVDGLEGSWSPVHDLAAFTLGVGGSILVAWVFCEVVEKPSQRLARRVSLVS